MGWFRNSTNQLLILTVILVYAQCNTTSTKNFEVKKDPLGKSAHTYEGSDYDENYYKGVGNVADLQNRTVNLTNSIGNDDDEDSTNGDYLDELGSTVDDVFQNFDPDPYLGTHFRINETTEVPTITQQNENTQADFEVTEPVVTLMSTVPNYTNDTLPKCPDGFETYLSETGTICFLENLASIYPPPCPYPNIIETHTLPYQITANKTIWATPIAKMFDNFGAEFVRDTWNYNSSQLACAISYNSSVISTSCNQHNPAICAYSYENAQYSFDSYCEKKFNDSCVSADLGTGKKCYCIVRSHVAGQIRNNFCNKLAEPLEPYQNLLLLKKLTNKDVCWIGFYQGKDGGFKWSSSNLLTNYTYWSFTTEFTKTFGAIGHKAWSLEEEGDLSCAVCEVDITDHPSVRLHVKHTKITNKIRLTVDNANEIFGGINCYSYGNEYHLDLSGNYHNHLEFDVYDVNDIPRYYWCKALEMPNLTPTYSNRILAHTTTADAGREYAIANKAEIPVSPYFMSELVFNETNNLLYHIHTVPSNYTIQEELDFLTKFISAEIKSSEVCLPSTTFSNNVTLNWAQSLIGSVILPSVYCVQDNGYPVTRKCSGSFLYGAAWSNVNGTCFSTAEINATLLYQGLIGSQNSSTEKPTLVEIHTLINFLKGVTSFSEFIQALNNLMNYPVNSFKEAQYLLNSTDTLLDTLKVRVTEEVDLNTLTNITLNNVVVRVVDLSNVSTFGLNFHQDFARAINNDTDLSQDFDIIVRLPEELHRELKNCTVSSKLVFTLLKSEALFGDLRQSDLVHNSVLIMAIPHSNKCNLALTSEVFIKVSLTNELKCASWFYGSNDLLEKIHGYWFIEDAALDKFESFKMCKFRFGVYSTLIDQRKDDTASGNTQKIVLTILGIIATVVSALSLIGVLVTTVIFKSHTCSHIAVINLSFSAAIQIILTFVAITFNIEGTSCVTIAAVLHYTTLTQFLWTAIIAWLEHQFYLTEQQHQEKLIVQMCFVVWGLPLLAVVILASVSNLNYGKISYDTCYAMGDNFTYSVLLPVSVLLLISLLILGKIVASIRCSKKIRTHHFVKQTAFSQLKLAVMVYLLLGITWGLGILAAAVERKAIPFVYCISGCVQEIVIFLFFIVLNEKTRTLWVGVKTICCMGKSKGYELTPKRRRRKTKYTTSRF